MPEIKLNMEDMTAAQIKAALSDNELDAVFNVENVSIGVKEVDNRVSYHAPSKEGIKRHGYLSAAFALLMNDIDEIVPPGREKSIAITKLEEALHWSKSAITRNNETV